MTDPANASANVADGPSHVFAAPGGDRCARINCAVALAAVVNSRKETAAASPPEPSAMF